MPSHPSDDEIAGSAVVPYVHRPEVGAVGFRISDTHDYRHLVVVIQPFERAHVGVERDTVVERDDLLAAKSHDWSVVVVQSVLVGNDGIQIVVSSGKLDYNQVFRPAVAPVTVCGHLLTPGFLTFRPLV